MSTMWYLARCCFTSRSQDRVHHDHQSQYFRKCRPTMTAMMVYPWWCIHNLQILILVPRWLWSWDSLFACYSSGPWFETHSTAIKRVDAIKQRPAMGSLQTITVLEIPLMCLNSRSEARSMSTLQLFQLIAFSASEIS